MKLSDYLFLIFKYLKNKKIRTFLTSLGITIGVATIFTIISLSNGLKYAIENELNKIGGKAIYIIPGVRLGFTSIISGTISNNFIENIKKLPGVERVIPAVSRSDYIIIDNKKLPIFLFIVNSKDSIYLQYAGMEVYKGTNALDSNCKVIIGYDIANNNIKKLDIGDMIYLSNNRCRVIGILKQTGSPIIDNRIIISLEFYKKIKPDTNYNYLIVLTNDYNLAYNSIKNYIDSLKGQNYMIITAENIKENINSILNFLTIYSLLLAAVSILISSISILNTMWTSVLERYKEIGLLKALGMKNSQIFILFILESGFIGLTGGILGIFFGIIAGNIASYIFSVYGLSFSPYITIELILFSLLFPFFVGMISGIIPAMKAARINPVEALRYE